MKQYQGYRNSEFSSICPLSSWRIEDAKDGNKHVRYIKPEGVAAAMRQKVQEAIPKAKRWLKNNVEAAMFQLTFHTSNNKTRY